MTDDDDTRPILDMAADAARAVLRRREDAADYRRASESPDEDRAYCLAMAEAADLRADSEERVWAMLVQRDAESIGEEPLVVAPEPDASDAVTISALDLIELHAYRLLTEWERADWRNRSVSIWEDTVIAHDKSRRRPNGEEWMVEAKDHVELADVMGLGNLA